MEFKVGDVVRRIAGMHKGMRVGDIATVVKMGASRSIELKEWEGIHDFTNFEVTAVTNWREHMEG